MNKNFPTLSILSFCVLCKASVTIPCSIDFMSSLLKMAPMMDAPRLLLPEESLSLNDFSLSKPVGVELWCFFVLLLTLKAEKNLIFSTNISPTDINKE